jgi:hypothetical protein
MISRATLSETCFSLSLERFLKNLRSPSSHAFRNTQQKKKLENSSVAFKQLVAKERQPLGWVGC